SLPLSEAIRRLPSTPVRSSRQPHSSSRHRDRGTVLARAFLRSSPARSPLFQSAPEAVLLFWLSFWSSWQARRALRLAPPRALRSLPPRQSQELAHPSQSFAPQPPCAPPSGIDCRSHAPNFEHPLRACTTGLTFA